MPNAHKDTFKETLKQEGKLLSAPKRSTVHTDEIIAYINKNITKELSLEELSQRFNVSKYYLSHFFKAHTGLTLFRYIKLKRLGLVKKYYESGLPLTKSAMKAGFADYSIFYKAYRNEYGKSPSKDFSADDKK